MKGRSREFENWLSRYGPEQKERVERLAELVHNAQAGLDEAIKWQRLTLTANGDWHHWLCAIAANKREVSLVFHKGVLLDDPEGLLQGGGRYIRQIPYEKAVKHEQAVAALVRQAVARQTDMLD